MSTLVFYGGYCLTNAKFTTNFNGTRPATSLDVQSIPLSRAAGSHVVNTRYEAKEIELAGTLKGNPTSYSTQYSINELTKALSSKREQYLRIVPEYEFIIDGLSFTPWVAGPEVGTFTSGISPNTEYQTGNAAIIFTATTATEITMTWNGEAWDGDGKFNSLFNIEAIIHLSNALGVQSFEMRLGNDSSNYYKYIVTADHQGYPIHNGPNILSVPANAYTEEVGNVTNSEIDYFQFTLSRSSGEVALTSLSNYFDSLMLVTEGDVRNYPSYRIGEVEISGRHHDIDTANWSARFINHKGYAIRTHYEDVFIEEGISSVSDLQSFNMNGNYEPHPLFTVSMETATDITALQIENVNTGESINMIPSTITGGDVVVFGGVDNIITRNGVPVDFEGRIPTFDTGYNNVRLIVGNDIVTDLTPATPITSNAYRTANVWGTTPTQASKRGYHSQSFVVDNDNDLTSFSFWLTAVFGTSEVGFDYSHRYYFAEDNAGEPSTSIIYEGVIPNGEITGGENVIDGLNLTMVSGTKYHFVLETSYQTTYYTTGANASRIRWDYNTSDVYADGECYYQTVTYTAGASTASSWALKSGDNKFRAVQTTDPSWLLNWSAKYKRLYQN